MSSCVKFRKEEYIITQNNHGKKVYYTIVNTKLNTHVHINCGIKTAKILVSRAINNNFKHLNEFMRNKLSILLGNNEDWNSKHGISYNSHNLY